MWRDQKWERGREVEKKGAIIENGVGNTHTFSISTGVSNDENAVSGESNLLLVQLSQASINVYVVQSKRLCLLTICIRGQIENTYTHYDRSFFLLLFIQHINETKNEKKSECKAKTKRKQGKEHNVKNRRRWKKASDRVIITDSSTL